jgi:hypothetical protein
VDRRTVLAWSGALLLAACAPRDERTAVSTVPTPTATLPPTATARPPTAPPTRRTPVVAPLVLPPARLRIPRIAVDAPVQEVGLDARGELVIPTNGDYVVWYGASAPPGLPGNSVFAGHVDWGGRLAVFARLKDLVAGDEIETVATDGTTRRFVVRELWSFETGAAPLELVYGPTATPSVTLITCGGVFDSRTRDYSLRIVVRGESR